MLRIGARIFSLLVSLLCGASALAADIRLWHSMNGARGAEFDRLVARFNASQKQFRVVATYKGAYDEAASSAHSPAMKRASASPRRPA